MPTKSTQPEQEPNVIVEQSSDPSKTVELPKGERILSLDLLRGFVMILMALDHTRDYFSNANFDPTDLTKTNIALFLTRWITHYCAPTFVFLAGVSAYLYGVRRNCRKDLSWFLFSRGLWLVFLELTYVSFSWSFDLKSPMAQVIWALGFSMIILAGLVWLPVGFIGAFGIITIIGHNALDAIKPEGMASFKNAWIVLHNRGTVEYLWGQKLLILYPLVPWVGVMAVGYVLGGIYFWTRERRERFLRGLGLGLISAFVVVRGLNVYGDPNHWTAQASPAFTVLSFLNCQKYPPSLDYLLMTLGPSCLALSFLEGARGKFAEICVTLGRVPMFYYLLHIPLIYASSILFVMIQFRSDPSHLSTFSPDNPPPGFPLPVVYLVWIAMLMILYFPCRWFAGVKKRHRDVAWLSYF